MHAKYCWGNFLNYSQLKDREGDEMDVGEMGL
jgi:hypothetical protein